MSATEPAPDVPQLAFAQGTIELRGAPEDAAPPRMTWDQRSRCWRAPAHAYADVKRSLDGACSDGAAAFAELPHGVRVEREPRAFQTEALAAWHSAQGRGVVVLPTGAGKSHVGVLAIDAVRHSTLVVAPTLDLVHQWYELLRLAFAAPVGVVGGGDYVVEPITVTTYDSAYLHMDHLGDRFGLVIFDECHHLPSGSYALAAQGALAPWRLGLTATPERADGREVLLGELIGDVVYRRDIVEMTGEYLAEYEVQRVHVELSAAEREQYDRARATYRGFVSDYRIRMSARDGWQRFVMLSSQSRAGRAAMLAYQEQRRLAFAAPSKIDVLGGLLHRHRDDRALVFTEDNKTAYEISRRFLIPVISHQTKVTERAEILQGLGDGTFNAVATSKVLNEGVDIPAANVAIIVSGSGSVREHVQRLGRVLRKLGGKRAVLYELVAADTSEAFTSERRRDHVAYR
ncbi:MAG: DEAD/DEAH box helicase family protein [Planctomycetota bacterium]